MSLIVTTVYDITNRLCNEYSLGDLLFNVETVTPTQVVDSRLVDVASAQDRYLGAFVRISSGVSYANEVRRIQSYDPLTGTISVFPALINTYGAGAHIQIWKYYDPTNIIYDIETALKVIPVRTFVPLTHLDTYTFSIIMDGKPFRIVFELEGEFEDYVTGQFSFTISDKYTSPVVTLVQDYKASYIAVEFIVNEPMHGIFKINPVNSTNGYLRNVHVIREHTNSLYVTALSSIHIADIHGIYEAVDYFDTKLDEHIYAVKPVNISNLKKVNGWTMPNERTLIMPHNIRYPIFAYTSKPVHAGTVFNYNTGYNIAFDVNENLLLHKTAEIIFSRMLSNAAIIGIDTKWAEMQLVRAQQNVAQEMLKENMRARANTPKGQDVEYILGDTYLGSVW